MDESTKQELTIIEGARAKVDAICAEKRWKLDRIADWQNILGEIDARYDKRRYKCRYCFDSGIVSWIDPDDGLFYGRRCGFCRYWDEQREKARAKRK